MTLCAVIQSLLCHVICCVEHETTRFLLCACSWKFLMRRKRKYHTNDPAFNLKVIMYHFLKKKSLSYHSPCAFVSHLSVSRWASCQTGACFFLGGGDMDTCARIRGVPLRSRASVRKEVCLPGWYTHSQLFGELGISSNVFYLPAIASIKVMLDGYLKHEKHKKIKPGQFYLI